MSTRRISAVASVVAAALGIAACGSSSSSSSSAAAAPASSGSTSSSSGGGGGSATLNGAGSTLAAPIYQQWGSTLKGQGLTVNYNPVGSGAGVARAAGGDGRLRGQRPGAQAG